MKNKFWILTASVLIIATLTATVMAATANPTDPIEPAAVTGTCPENEHVFDQFRGYSAAQNQHTYDCSNEGCDSYLVDTCYYHGSCTLYSDVETLPCEKCGYGTVYIHEYVIAHKPLTSNENAQHIYTCTAFDGYYYCGRTQGDAENCNFSLQISSTFVEDRGHPKLYICGDCAYSYRDGYEYPENHPVGCKYCQ